MTIAAACIRRDQKSFRFRETMPSHFHPPTPNAVGCELVCVVIDADTHPAFVFRDVIHAVRNRLAKFFVRTVFAVWGMRVRFGRRFFG
jgi:hypothetical protein